jgi:hypothetical protein
LSVHERGLVNIPTSFVFDSDTDYSPAFSM